MSDLGTLFRMAPTGIENFVSAALAIAINKDARPMISALHELNWPTPPDRHPFNGGDFRPNAAAITGLKAAIQVPLVRATGAAAGFLDLVLAPGTVAGESAELWVEVKVDAPETGDQLDVYAKHAESKEPTPAVITLARGEVRPTVAALTWNDLSDSIDATSAPHEAWLALREFLVAEWIARPALPSSPESRADDFIKVLLQVNEVVKELWPTSGPELFWVPGALQNALDRGFRTDRRMLATAGPLRYGVVPRDDRWHWWLAVSPKVYAGPKLDSSELLAMARAHGLIPRWGPLQGRPEILELTRPVEALSKPYEVEVWFRNALVEIQTSGMVDSYLGRAKPSA